MFGLADVFVQVATRSAMISGGFLLAQTDSPFDFGDLLNYGVLGIVVVAFFTDRLVTKSAMDRVIAERDKAEQARDEIIREQFDRVIPLMEILHNRLIPLMEEVNERGKKTDELIIRLSNGA